MSGPDLVPFPRAHPPGGLHLSLRPSRTATLVLVCLHAGAALCLVQALGSAALACAGAAALAASLAVSLRRHALLRSPRAVVRITAAGGGSWRLHTRAGRTLHARVAPGSYVHPSLVVLCFHTDAGAHSVLIAPDMADAAALRRLRVRLRAEGGGEAAAGPRAR